MSSSEHSAFEALDSEKFRQITAEYKELGSVESAVGICIETWGPLSNKETHCVLPASGHFSDRKGLRSPSGSRLAGRGMFALQSRALSTAHMHIMHPQHQHLISFDVSNLLVLIVSGSSPNFVSKAFGFEGLQTGCDGLGHCRADLFLGSLSCSGV